MHSHSLEHWRHEHVFLSEKHDRHERRTWFVVALTAAMMVAEIVGGNIFGSMALVADGWHMSTHAAALGIAALAYRVARTYARDPRFSFGTGKVGELAGFASAVILALIALWIGWQSATRLIHPVSIAFDHAIPIATAGLIVNLLSAWLLFDHHDDNAHTHPHHHHGHDHHHHHHQDTNYRAAYVHVVADAFTSVLAIAALLAGRYFGAPWLDPVIGIVGTTVILAWSWSLIRSAASTLLDMVPDSGLAATIRARIEINGDKLADLHLWRLGPGHVGIIASIVSHDPRPPGAYKERLAGIAQIAHTTVEVHACE